MTTRSFSVAFDYRCPFARNASEHVVAAMRAGAPYEVTFRAFSLPEVHVPEGGLSVFDDPSKRNELVAQAAALVVRERFPDRFLAVHTAFFVARHEHGRDLREEETARAALKEGGADADAVFAELDAGWPYDLLATEHRGLVASHAVFGVPTFIAGEQAAFVRLLSRPRSGEEARATIDRVLDLLTSHTELNEFKHTSIPR
ncbi:MAG TPA: DsbA family protein [Acidimicrobiales bacterium]|jgi:hypothetical protein|nr:DsbA family protein [Acidimicrobiales bacterium]